MKTREENGWLSAYTDDGQHLASVSITRRSQKAMAATRRELDQAVRRVTSTPHVAACDQQEMNLSRLQR